MLLAFTSSRRFVGRFYLRPTSIEVVADTEGLELAPGARWTLEEFMFATGPSRTPLFDRLAARIVQNHPPLKVRDGADRLVLVVLLRAEGHGGAGAGESRRHREDDPAAHLRAD